MPMIFSKPQRKTVAVDLDQTLAHTLEALLEWHNEVYHTDLCLADLEAYGYSSAHNSSALGTREEACYKIREFYESDHFARVRPIDDFALEALKMLKKRKFNLVIITSRQQFIAEETKKFVDKHYPGIFDSIYFCNLNLSDAEQLEYVSKPKSAICQEIGVDVLIDDDLNHALDCAALDMEVLLYDRKGQYKWNHERPRKTAGTLTSMSRQLYQPSGPLPPNVTRVKSWKEIIAYFPKPKSPLRYCYYPQDLEQDDSAADEEEEDKEDSYDDDYVAASYHHGNYETVEIDGLAEDEEDYNCRSSIW